MKLNDQTYKNAKPKDKTYKIFNGGGLYLEITPKAMQKKLTFLKFIMLALTASFPVSAANVFKECGVTGSVTIYDKKDDLWVYSDQDDVDKPSLPASTFKILNTLIALDRGVTDKNEIFKWDKRKRQFAQWNKDTKIEDAFKNSTIWVYEILASRLSPKTYQQYFQWTGYGNKNISNGKDGNFWVYGSFGVTPKEQILMLNQLYENTLPFSQKTMQTVKSYMQQKSNPKIFGKTGWTKQNNMHVGWWVGYVEKNDNEPVFFATRLWRPLTNELGDFLSCRKSITDYYLKSLEINKK